MKRATKKALMAAIGGIFIHGLSPSTAQAQTSTWKTTSGSQDWFTAANWTNGVPSSGATALFSVNAPPSNTVTLGAASTSVGGIIDLLSNNNSALSIGGTGTLSLSGVNFTATYTTGVVNESNVVIGNVSNTTNYKTFGFVNTMAIALMGANDTIISGSASGTTMEGQSVTINGSIIDGAGVHAKLQIDGGGNASTDGGTVFLNSSSNFYSGGTVIGAADETHGASLLLVADAATADTLGNVTVNSTASGTGDIYVNPGSQIFLKGTGTSGQTLYFGAANTTWTLYGIGLGKNSSGTIRTTSDGSTVQTFDILANMVLGTSTTADQTNGNVVFSPTSSGARIIQLSGVITSVPGFTGINKQGSGGMEFSNPNNNFGGAMQIGNGDIVVDPGSSIGSGDLTMFQTGSNFTVANFYNSVQIIGNLSSNFTLSSGTDTQVIHLNGTLGAANQGGTPGSGTTLTLNQTNNTTYGFGKVNTLTSTIDGPGSLVLNAGNHGTLSFTGVNQYTGSTVINGAVLNAANGTLGSATGTVGDVIVNSGGALSSGGGQSVFLSVVTTGTVGGVHDGNVFTNLNVNAGGLILPGGDNLAGTLDVGGNLNAAANSVFSFDLIGGTIANSDLINVAGALDTTGVADINIKGSSLAFGNYTLFTANTLTNSTATFNITGTPTPLSPSIQRTYNVAETVGGDGSGTVVLQVVDTGTDRFWSVGGINPASDGSGNWSPGNTNFFVQSGTSGFTQVAYTNSFSSDLVIGAGGNSGTINLTGNVEVNGPLVFGQVQSGGYMIAGTNSLQLDAGLVSSNNTTISAPIILGATSGTSAFSASIGTTLILSGGVGETGRSQRLVTSDLGTIVLGGTGGYTGGTQINQGNLQVTTASLPATGGVQVGASGNLVFSQSFSGSYAGLISASGAVVISNTPSAVVSLSNTGNTYTGPTILQSGTLAVDDANELGGGNSSLFLSGGTLHASNTLSFPGPGSLLPGAPHTALSLVLGTTSVIDTNGFDVTMNQNVGGPGNFNKIGNGNLTLTGLPSTTLIGTVGILAGTLTFAPPALSPSFGITAPADNSNSYSGDLTIATSMELRLLGGNFSGGGKINVIPNGISIDSHSPSPNIFVTTVIGNVINVNPENAPSFSVNLFAATGNTLEIDAPIVGNTDVNFNGGNGTVNLGATSSYTGNTEISTGAGEVHILVDNALPATTTVDVGSGDILDIDGVSQKVFALTSNNRTAEVQNEGATPATIVISGSAKADYQGILQDGQLSTLGLTLDANNTGWLTLDGDNLLAGFGTGLSGPVNVIGGRLELETPSALGAPSTITVGADAGNSQLRFDGVTGTLIYTSTSEPDGADPSPIILNGTGGYTPSSDVYHPGAISVENQSQLILPSSITVAVNSDIAVEAGSTLQVTGNIGGSGALEFSEGGTATLSGSNTWGGGTKIDSGMTLIAATAMPSGGAVANNGVLNLQTGGVLGHVSGNGAMTIGQLGHPITVQLAANTHTHTQGSITINAGSKLDITNNTLQINYGANADPIATIASEIGNGYNGGAWTGASATAGLITSSTAAAGGPVPLAVGYADGNTDIGTAAGANQIVVKYTISGDANLNGSVDFNDLVAVVQNFNKGGTDWAHGNFLFSATTNFNDLVAVVQNFNKSATPAESSGGSLGGNTLPLGQVVQVHTDALPEPASLALLGIGAGSLVARRRRRKM